MLFVHFLLVLVACVTKRRSAVGCVIDRTISIMLIVLTARRSNAEHPIIITIFCVQYALSAWRIQWQRVSPSKREPPMPTINE